MTGADLQGTWEVKRRYNEFFLLHEALVKRWPGIVIPCVPPKQAMGNKDIAFLQERRFYLERFIKKVSRYDFIINSQEFQIFSRPQGLEVDKSLSKLPKLSNSQLYDRLKEATQTDDENMTNQDRDIIEIQMNEFMVFVKKAEPFLKKLKEELATFLSRKQLDMLSYAGTQNILAEYEETNLRYYTDNDIDKLVVRNTDANSLLESMRHTVEKLRNPFTDLYHWIKGELYDLAACSMALKERKAVQANVADLKKKIAGIKSDIESIS